MAINVQQQILENRFLSNPERGEILTLFGSYFLALCRIRKVSICSAARSRLFVLSGGLQRCYATAILCQARGFLWKQRKVIKERCF
jgi:hypothetical protein